MKIKQFVVFLLLVASGLTEANALTFGDALKKREISYQVVAIPGPRRMLLKIKNLLHRERRVELEAGRFFHHSSSTQPFVISRPVAIDLDPGEEREIPIRAYCGSASAKAPLVGQEFKTTDLGSKNLCDVLNMMSKYHIVSENLYQDIIWFYTNKFNVATIYTTDVDGALLGMVQKYICEKEGLKLPKYNLNYAPSASGDVLEFSGRPETIVGKFELKLEQRTDLHVKVLDAQGKQVELVEVHVDQPAGEIEIPMAIGISNYKLGDYTICVSDEHGNIISSMPVTVS